MILEQRSPTHCLLEKGEFSELNPDDYEESSRFLFNLKSPIFCYFFLTFVILYLFK